MTAPTTRKLMLRACPRCQGDLLFDSYEEDFACLQCGRHTNPANVVASLTQVVTAETKVAEPLAA